MMRAWFDRRNALEALQLLIGVLALAWVVTQPDWDAIGRGLGQLSIWTILAIGLLTVLGVVAKFVMWSALLRQFRPTSLSTAGRIELSVNFVNQLLPSRLSGRLAAPLVVRQNTGVDWNTAVAVAIAHTGLFALVYGVVALVGLAVGVTRFPYGISLLILLSVGLYFLAGGVILGAAAGLDGRVGRWVDAVGGLPGVRWLRSAITGRLLEFPLDFSTVAPSVRSIATDGRALATFGAGWTIALAVVPGLRLWLLFEAMGASVSPIWALPLFAIAAYSVTLLPLTPGGIGVTEATATIVFVAVGVPSAVAVPAVLIDRFVGVYLPALCGWYPTMGLDLSALREGEAQP